MLAIGLVFVLKLNGESNIDVSIFLSFVLVIGHVRASTFFNFDGKCKY